ncbi:MAG: UDP-N-acetylmuramate dehydrogenase [Patescibacteria group bacterium]
MDIKRVQKGVSLKEFTTFRIGGKAEYFFEAETKEELIGTILEARVKNMAFFVLGGGSNILVSDAGFKGLVISLKFFDTEFLKNSRVRVEAGLSLASLVTSAARNKYSGLEWASGIPGTVGGAVCGNAGAFGRSMKDLIEEVEFFDVKKGKIKKFSGKLCEFDYRSSIFKNNSHYIILSVLMKLYKGKQEEIEEKMREYLDYRRERQPLMFPSAGSIFKNPKNDSAGRIIDQAGLRGKKIGNVQVSEKHANFIVNLGGGKAKDVVKLIELIKETVKEKFKINLEEEIQYVGFN